MAFNLNKLWRESPAKHSPVPAAAAAAVAVTRWQRGGRHQHLAAAATATMQIYIDSLMTLPTTKYDGLCLEYTFCEVSNVMVFNYNELSNVLSFAHNELWWSLFVVCPRIPAPAPSSSSNSMHHCYNGNLH